MIFRVTKYSEVSFEVTKIGFDVKSKEYVGKIMGEDYKYVYLDKAIKGEFSESEVIPILMKEGLGILEGSNNSMCLGLHLLPDRNKKYDKHEYQKYGV